MAVELPPSGAFRMRPPGWMPFWTLSAAVSVLALVITLQQAGASVLLGVVVTLLVAAVLILVPFGVNLLGVVAVRVRHYERARDHIGEVTTRGGRAKEPVIASAAQ